MLHEIKFLTYQNYARPVNYVSYVKQGAEDQNFSYPFDFSWHPFKKFNFHLLQSFTEAPKALVVAAV